MIRIQLKKRQPLRLRKAGKTGGGGKKMIRIQLKKGQPLRLRKAGKTGGGDKK